MRVVVRRRSASFRPGRGEEVEVLVTPASLQVRSEFFERLLDLKSARAFLALTLEVLILAIERENE